SVDSVGMALSSASINRLDQDPKRCHTALRGRSVVTPVTTQDLRVSLRSKPVVFHPLPRSLGADLLLQAVGFALNIDPGQVSEPAAR
ncbi:MAG: hypothetical protein ACRCZF_13550, partial [Gemmataceae bacterium]